MVLHLDRILVLAALLAAGLAQHTSAQARRLNGPLVQLGDGGPVLGDVFSFQAPALDRPESRVVFRADADTDQSFQLYSASLHGPRDLRLVSGATHLDVGDFARSATGNFVVYSNNQKHVLYSTRADGLGPVIEIDRGTRQFTTPFLISLDEQRVVYRKNLAADLVALFSQRLEGTEAVVRLNTGAISASSVQADFALTPDSASVVYRSDDRSDGVFELFVVPIDGSSAPLRLNSPLFSAGVKEFQIGPDGTRVFYRADQPVSGRFELYAVPLTGAFAPLRISAPLLSPRDVRDVTSFRVSSDGERVVYRADHVVDEQFELYSAPSRPVPPLRSIDGVTRAAAIRLT